MWFPQANLGTAARRGLFPDTSSSLFATSGRDVVTVGSTVTPAWFSEGPDDALLCSYGAAEAQRRKSISPGPRALEGKSRPESIARSQ